MHGVETHDSSRCYTTRSRAESRSSSTIPIPRGWTERRLWQQSRHRLCDDRPERCGHGSVASFTSAVSASSRLVQLDRDRRHRDSAGVVWVVLLRGMRGCFNRIPRRHIRRRHRRSTARCRFFGCPNVPEAPAADRNCGNLGTLCMGGSHG
jgi:hypothetical protein